MTARMGLKQDDEVLPAHLFNPGGHFESVALFSANEKILRSLGYSWDKPPISGLSRGEIDRIRRTGLLTELRRDFASWSTARDWFDKDPRLSLTLPVWDEVLLRRAPAIICIRHPAEVALSLSLREGMPYEYGLILWICYNKSIASLCSGRDTLVVDYQQDILDGADSLAQKIGDFIKSCGYHCKMGENQQAAGIVKKDYQRNNYLKIDATCQRLNEAINIYELLKKTAIEEWEGAISKHTSLRGQDEQWLGLYGRIIDGENREGELERKLDEAQRRLEEASAVKRVSEDESKSTITSKAVALLTRCGAKLRRAARAVVKCG